MNIFQKMVYVIMSTTLVRFKYYHAWILADAICNNSGLGFNGYDENNNPKWDGISNINILKFEVIVLSKEPFSYHCALHKEYFYYYYIF